MATASETTPEAGREGSARPIALIAFDALPEGRGRRVCAAGLDLAVFKVGDVVYAIDDSCPHAGASLSSGRLQGTQVRCGAHGLKFNLRNDWPGTASSLQARTYQVHVAEGMVMLEHGALHGPTDNLDEF